MDKRLWSGLDEKPILTNNFTPKSAFTFKVKKTSKFVLAPQFMSK